MENAQLVSLSRQIALQRQMDVVANNMANINTTGFKSESMLFQDYLMPVARDNDFAGSDDIVHYTEDWSTIHDMSTGSIEQTGNPLDVALSGDGFLTVQTPAGPRYSKNGSLQIDANGTLVDLAGNPVLGSSGPITFDSADTEIAIDRNGNISTSQGSKGKLALVEFSDPQVLARDMVVTVEHPLGGSIKMPGNPIKLSETHAETFSPPPLIGQHTEEVLQSLLGLSEAEIASLRQHGIVG